MLWAAQISSNSTLTMCNLIEPISTDVTYVMHFHVLIIQTANAGKEESRPSDVSNGGDKNENKQ
jgi:hypothetical protein